MPFHPLRIPEIPGNGPPPCCPPPRILPRNPGPLLAVWLSVGTSAELVTPPAPAAPPPIATDIGYDASEAHEDPPSKLHGALVNPPAAEPPPLTAGAEIAGRETPPIPAGAAIAGAATPVMLDSNAVRTASLVEFCTVASVLRFVATFIGSCCPPPNAFLKNPATPLSPSAP